MLACSACQSRHASRAALAEPDPARVLAGMPTTLHADLETSEGVVHCELDAARAPHAVALFVGLATGRTPWLEPTSGEIVSRALYRELPFFRAIAGVYAQSGCPLGNGTGSPGFRIEVEADRDDATRLGAPGALFLARYTAPPNRSDPAPPPADHVLGSQFVVALGNMQHLAGQVSVLGSCSNLEPIRAIADAVATHRKPESLRRVVIR